MRRVLEERCEQFIENRDRIRDGFRWESTYLYPLCAGIYTSRGVLADVEKLRACRELLKARTGIFSNFRGTSRLALFSLLALEERPEEYLEKALRVYDLLKGQFFASEYLPLAAMAVARMADPENEKMLVLKTRTLYDLMKKEHPFLTSGEDSAFAALLALSEKDEQSLVDEMESCYQLLKTEFYSGNAVQSLTHVLALGEGSPQMKCRRVKDLFQSLKAQGHRYGTSYELATLGVLALLEADTSLIAREMSEVDEYLKSQKGFGAFGVGSKQRLMYAGMIVMMDYMGEEAQTMQFAAASGVISLIVAEQVAICACVAASATAAANSSSS